MLLKRETKRDMNLERSDLGMEIMIKELFKFSTLFSTSQSSLLSVDDDNSDQRSLLHHENSSSS